VPSNGVHAEGAKSIYGSVFRLALLYLLSIAFNGALVLLDLLLIRLGLLLTLHVIAGQCAGAQSEGAADGSAGPRPTHGRADNATRRGSPHGANGRAFFPGGQIATRATSYPECQQARRDCPNKITPDEILHDYLASKDRS